MKQLIVIALLGYGAYQAFEYFTKPSAFNPDGSASVILFTYDKCGSACDDARAYLRDRVTFAELDVREREENLAQFHAMGGSNTMPLVVIGDQVLEGYWPEKILPALTRAYGLDGVSSQQRKALAKNFDANGQARLVMYSTQSCGYCKRARSFFQERGLAFTELDIERDAVAKRDFNALHGGGTPLIYRGLNAAYGFNPAQITQDLQL